jgi:hypothetical protein
LSSRFGNGIRREITRIPRRGLKVKVEEQRCAGIEVFTAVKEL